MKKAIINPMKSAHAAPRCTATSKRTRRSHAVRQRFGAGTYADATGRAAGRQWANVTAAIGTDAVPRQR